MGMQRISLSIVTEADDNPQTAATELGERAYTLADLLGSIEPGASALVTFQDLDDSGEPVGEAHTVDVTGRIPELYSL